MKSYLFLEHTPTTVRAPTNLIFIVEAQLDSELRYKGLRWRVRWPVASMSCAN